MKLVSIFAALCAALGLLLAPCFSLAAHASESAEASVQILFVEDMYGSLGLNGNPAYVEFAAYVVDENGGQTTFTDVEVAYRAGTYKNGPCHYTLTNKFKAKPGGPSYTADISQVYGVELSASGHAVNNYGAYARSRISLGGNVANPPSAEATGNCGQNAEYDKSDFFRFPDTSLRAGDTLDLGGTYSCSAFGGSPPPPPDPTLA